MNSENLCEKYDKQVFDLIKKEENRQKETIQLIAAENITRKEILFPLASIFVSKTAEGVPNNRYHSGCSVVDELETLAENRANALFNSKKTWVQPISGSMANLIVITSVLKSSKKDPKDFKMLAMGLDQGGHLSHGSNFHISKMLCPNVKYYSVNKNTGFLDYDEIKSIATDYKPDIIICGASAYPRKIDFFKMKDISDVHGSILISDIAHIYGLVVAGVHPSPIPFSHFVTCSTYKAGGPKGGMIIAGDLANEQQCNSITRTLFPGIQSTPDFASIASKAVFYKECMSEEYKITQEKIVLNAKTISDIFLKKGFDIVTGGTDNHIVLINVKKSFGLTGKDANNRLETCGINANKNLLPYDEEKSTVGSGIRIGTNTISRLGMGINEMHKIADFIELILLSDMSEIFVNKMRDEIKLFMKNFSLDKFI